VWDRHIIHKQRGIPISLSRLEWVAEKAVAKAWVRGAIRRATGECDGGLGGELEGVVLDWAEEVNKFAREKVYKCAVRWIKTHDLSEAWLVAKAGLRLGCWLNSIA